MCTQSQDSPHDHPNLKVAHMDIPGGNGLLDCCDLISYIRLSHRNLTNFFLWPKFSLIISDN